MDRIGIEYDPLSPFPPTKDQVDLCGQLLTNSIAALFAQQGPPSAISYRVVAADELILYTKPIIDFAIHQFQHECSFGDFGDPNFSKAAANKALSTLDKMSLMNRHHELMFDFTVWDIHCLN